MDLPPVDWFDIAIWSECARLERPGYAFEVQNAGGQAVQTNCAQTIQWPPDWAPPVRFRLVPEVLPKRSTPIPLPIER